MADDNVNVLMGIERLLKTHLSLYEQVCTERTSAEVESLVYKRLLKPWASCQASGDTATTKDKQSEPNTDRNEQKEIQYEDKEVTLINTVLAKAERARNSHKQVNPSKNEVKERQKFSAKDTTLKPASAHSTSNRHSVVSSPANGQMKSRTSNLPPDKGQEKTSSAKQCNLQTNQIGIISQSKLKQLTGKQVGASSSKRSTAFVPVHYKAPFKTEPGKIKLKRPSSGKVYNKAAGSAAIKQTQIHQDELPSHSVDSESRGDNPPRVEHVEVDHYSCSAASKLITKTNDFSDDKTSEQYESINKKFDLLRDGSKLSVPTKLQRMFTRNRYLRKKIQVCKLTVKVDTASQKDRFLEKLHQSVDVNEKVQLGEAVYKHTRLLQTLHEELGLLGLEHLSAGLSDEDVLRKRMILEMILTTYREVNPMITQLCKGLHSNDSDICPQQVELPSPLKCDETQLSHNSGPLCEVTEYKKEKDLMKYLLLQHNIKMLTIWEKIISEITEDILPHIENIADISSSSTVPLYRAVYALLSQPPGQLPTIVMDNMEDS